ncbi:hypothetical protein Neosp_013094 [[Neocosmospora] mangrovei]
MRAKARCTFDSAYARGRVPIIPPAPDVDHGTITIPTSPHLDSGESPSVSAQQAPVTPSTEGADAPTGLQSYNLASNSLMPSEEAPPVASLQHSPEPSQEDLQGHYIGPASGVSFLLRVQKRLHQAISFSLPGSIFTFGDAPLHPPDFDPSFCMMLPRDDAQHLIDRYFDFAMPTHRFLHRPTIQEWFVEFYDTLGTMRDVSNAPAKIGLLFMVFAHARVYMPEDDRPGPSDLSLALAIGLNRNKRPGAASGLSQVEVESRRRTFWCAYTLDTYLSMSLGRPRSFHDDDIDTELPACVEDHEITRDHISASALNRGYSIMLAPLAHMKLARIISKILRSLYSIKPVSASRRAEETERISKDLDEWRAELSRFLDADFFSSSLLVPIFQRQRNVLNLTFYHAIILTHRQSVLNNFARVSQQGVRSANESPQHDESVKQCLKAAMETVDTIDEITHSRQMFRAFWITAYFAFTAAMVLYIYVIQKWASPFEEYSSHFAAATRCQSHMSAIAEKGSLFERYCLVLEELRNEALRHINRMNPSTNGLEGINTQLQDIGFQNVGLTMDGSPSNETTYTDLIGQGAMDFNALQGATLTDFSGWNQFASMVSSGLGNLDVFLNDETFRI